MDTRKPGPIYEKKFFQLFFCVAYIKQSDIIIKSYLIDDEKVERIEENETSETRI